jgi:hypothetical protein
LLRPSTWSFSIDKVETINQSPKADNNFRYSKYEVLADLINLEKHILSRNKFNEVPVMSHLKKLVIFDTSFNGIRIVNKNIFKQTAESTEKLTEETRK